MLLKQFKYYKTAVNIAIEKKKIDWLTENQYINDDAQLWYLQRSRCHAAAAAKQGWGGDVKIRLFPITP